MSADCYIQKILRLKKNHMPDLAYGSFFRKFIADIVKNRQKKEKYC